jgi:hypothetical protein
MMAKTAPASELRMSAKEFDRIMGKALQVKPKTAKKPKKAPKTRTKKKRSR